jgi:hypothetical protein
MANNLPMNVGQTKTRDGLENHDSDTCDVTGSGEPANKHLTKYARNTGVFSHHFAREIVHNQ